MIDRYLISSPGRTGSHIVIACVRSAGVPALHTHNTFLKTDHDKITGLVLVLRKNLFDAVMSNCIAWHTNQFTQYKTTTIDSFTVDPGDFADQYRRHKWYAASHNLSRPYGSITTLYFEDFVNDHAHIFKELNLVQQSKLLSEPHVKNNFTARAPYNYRDVVVNHQECRQLFDRLEQTELPVLWEESQIYTGLKELNETWE